MKRFIKIIDDLNFVVSNFWNLLFLLNLVIRILLYILPISLQLFNQGFFNYIMQQLLRSFPIIYLLLVSHFPSHHECLFLECGSGPVEHKHRLDPKVQQFAYPSEKAIDHLEIIWRRRIVGVRDVVLSILKHIQELDDPDGHVDGEDLPLEGLQEHFSPSWCKMLPETFHSHLFK